MRSGRAAERRQVYCASGSGRERMMRREWAIMAIDSSTLAIDLNGSLFVCLFV